MKTFNRKLLATTGLFIALGGLTSFNPFSQVKHLSYLEKEESISLAASTVPAAGRTAQRGDQQANNARRGQSNSVQQVINNGQAGKTTPAKAKSGTEADKAKGSQSQTVADDPDQTTIDAAKKVEGAANKVKGAANKVKAEKEKRRKKSDPDVIAGDCTGKDCESKKNKVTADISAISEIIDNDENLTAEQKKLAKEKLNASNEDSVQVTSDSDDNEEEAEEALCPDGDYKERISCYKKLQSALYKKKSKATDETRDLYEEELEEFIAEIAVDEELDAKDQGKLLKKISKVASKTKNAGLLQDVNIALKNMDVRRGEQAFAQRLESQVRNIESIDSQLRQIQMYGSPLNPQTHYQTNMLQIQRKNLIYGMENEIAGYRESIRSSLPSKSLANEESTLVSELRNQRASSYEALVSQVAPVISDKSLVSLDATLSGTVASQTGLTTPGTSADPLNPGAPAYDSVNPANSFAGVDRNLLAGMSPTQQVQYRIQNGISFNGGLNNGVGNNGVYGAPAVNNGIPNTGVQQQQPRGPYSRI